MTTLLLIRRADVCAASIVLSCLGLLAIGTGQLHIAVAEVTVPWAFLIPLLLATASLTLTSTAFAEWERTAARGVAARNVILRAAFIAIAAALTWASVLWRTPDASALALEVARNVTGMVGIALAVSTLFGFTAGGIIPLCYFALALMTGRGDFREPHWWAWVIAPGDNWPATLLASALALAGIVSPATHRTNRYQAQ